MTKPFIFRVVFLARLDDKQNWTLNQLFILYCHGQTRIKAAPGMSRMDVAQKRDITHPQHRDVKTR